MSCYGSSRSIAIADWSQIANCAQKSTIAKPTAALSRDDVPPDSSSSQPATAAAAAPDRTQPRQNSFPSQSWQLTVGAISFEVAADGLKANSA